ncbi:MAG: sugar transferase [Ferruginibacter sp.]
MYKAFGKRIFDLVISLVGFVVLIPVFLLVTIILLIANKGKAFFFQERPGKNRQLFKVIKFRTMNDAKDTNNIPLPDAKRLTGIGRFVRKISLDEIPQLLNVIKGDMSLVGPRPLLVEYLPLYNETQSRRHNILPGITGWAQVNGRNALSWEQKFEYDIYYLEHVSFFFDLRILIKTVQKVLRAEGISQKGHETMPLFTGSPK